MNTAVPTLAKSGRITKIPGAIDNLYQNFPLNMPVRTTFRELCEKVGVSTPTLRQTLDRLAAKKVITFTTVGSGHNKGTQLTLLKDISAAQRAVKNWSMTSTNVIAAKNKVNGHAEPITVTDGPYPEATTLFDAPVVELSDFDVAKDYVEQAKANMKARQLVEHSLEVMAAAGIKVDESTYRKALTVESNKTLECIALVLPYIEWLEGKVNK